MSQSLSALDTTACIDKVVEVVLDYIGVHKNYSTVIFLWPDDKAWKALAEACASAVRKKFQGVSVSVRKASSQRFPSDVRGK